MTFQPKKMDPAVKAKWVNALRSGDYNQGTDCLRTPGPNPSYCCLGVLSEIAVGEGVIPEPEFHGGDWLYGDANHVSWSALPYAVAQWAGLYDENNPDHIDGLGVDVDVATETEVVPDNNRKAKLSYLNDRGSTFDQIAAIIEDQL